VEIGVSLPIRDCCQLEKSISTAFFNIRITKAA
jgi:hypothetical protein